MDRYLKYQDFKADDFVQDEKFRFGKQIIAS